MYSSHCCLVILLVSEFKPANHFKIMFRSEEAAKDALLELADGFEIDEGDRQVTMRSAFKLVSFIQDQLHSQLLQTI